MSQHYYFFEKLKIVEKQLCKLNCSYGKVSQTLKAEIFHFEILNIRNCWFLDNSNVTFFTFWSETFSKYLILCSS